MSNPIGKFYRAAHQAWFNQRKKGLRQRIEQRHGQTQDAEEKAVIAFLRKHPALELPMHMTPPYEWTNEYRAEFISVARDEGNGLLFVSINGHRVFFPRKATSTEVQQAVAIGLMEQDRRSPHRYVGDGFDVDSGDVAVFIGASDGLFCLSLIDRLSKAYLFEPNSDWHEPLRATFAPWGNRVEIVPLAAASSDCPGCTSLDSFFQNRPLPNYIQMDVDGAERDVLAGAMNVLRRAAKLRLSICTYHKRLDFPEFEQLLKNEGYIIGNSPGFFLIGVRMPYFRRGILYASRGITQPAPVSVAGQR